MTGLEIAINNIYTTFSPLVTQYQTEYLTKARFGIDSQSTRCILMDVKNLMAYLVFGAIKAEADNQLLMWEMTIEEDGSFTFDIDLEQDPALLSINATTLDCMLKNLVRQGVKIKSPALTTLLSSVYKQQTQ